MGRSKTILANCFKCGKEFDAYSPHGTKKACSSICARSRGPRTDEFKDKVRQRLAGRKIVGRKKRPVVKVTNYCVICTEPTEGKRKTCSNPCRLELLSRKSKAHPKCGGQKHTHKTYMLNICGQSFCLESSYEVAVAQQLNALGILWERPGPLYYVDGDLTKRRYHPDFYLPSFGLYLDPKNDYLIQTDIVKIGLAAEQNAVTVLILKKEFISNERLKGLVGDDGNAPPYPGCKPGALLLS